MLKTLLQASLTGFLILFLISCEKDPTSGANVGGTSFYSFAGTPSACSAPVIAGLYNAGMPMSTANTLTFTVSVTVKGTYSINTTSANGVWFSGSGVFPATGNQTVILYGNGTPAKQGSFAFVPVTNNTCNFSVSFGSGAPAAVFTYAGAPGNCTAPVVNGTYASGISLGAANYVDLAVNVTTPGAYTINTNSANGIGFSGSGAFTAAGPQVVRLIGNGTPAAAGTNVYKPTGGCSFNITVTPPAPPATFTYDGGTGACITPVISGTFAAGTALTSSSTIILGVNVTVAGSYSITTTSSNNNGVTFSASGVFTGTGPKTITLTSTNTPTAAGTFTYTPSGGCSFDVTYTTGPPPPADFIKFSVDGGPLLTFALLPIGFNDNSSAPYNITVSAELTSGGDYFSISVTDENTPVVTGFDYKNRNLLASPTKYCEIEYGTGSPLPYGSQIAASNSFTVRLTSLNATTVTGTFSGKVYDNLGTGSSSKTISNGTFSINF